MNPSLPQATHVPVRNGRIFGAGTPDELKGWGDFELDTIFADKVLMILLCRNVQLKEELS